MKKVIFSIVLFLLPALILTDNLQAQQFASSSTAKTGTPSINTPDRTGAKSIKTMKKEAREARQFQRVSRSFKKAYSGATDLTWTHQNNSYGGAFTRDGLKHIVWYRNDGSLINSMVTYGEQQMPEDVKSLVKRKYKGYTISLVNEVHQDDIVVYVVTLENEKYTKLITVCEGVINIYKEYRKA